MIKTVLLYGAILAVSYYLSTAIVKKPDTIRYFALMVVCSLAFIYNISLFFYVGILLIFNAFGLLRVDLRVAGFFKPYDMGLIFCLISGTIIYLKHYRHTPGIFKGAFTPMALIFTGFVFLQMLLTTYFEGQSLTQSVQMGRHHIPSLIYFGAIPFFLYNKKWEKYFRWIAILTIIGAFIYVIQVIFNFQFMRGFYSKTGTNKVAGVRLPRFYGGLIQGPIYFTASMIFAYIICGHVDKLRRWLWLSVGILGMQPILSFGRAYTVCFFIQLSCVLMLAPIPQMRKLKILFSGALLVILLLTGASLLKFGNLSSLLNLAYLRLYSAQTEFTESEGSYSVRDEIVQERMVLVRQSPFFGVGFIHPSSGLYPEFGSIISTGHQGFISLFTQLGFFGFGIFVLFTLVIVGVSMKAIRSNLPFFYQAAGMTMVGYIIQGYPHMISTSSFISFQSYAYIGLFMALLRVGFLRQNAQLPGTDG